MLRVNNVQKIFKSSRGRYIALDGASLTISDGEFLCLLGPSGCGKSTLLNILAGFEPATAGSVMADDAPVKSAGRDRVMFFQDAGSALFPWLNVEENVRFGLRVRKIPKAEWPSIIDKYLVMVGLTPTVPNSPLNCQEECGNAYKLRVRLRLSLRCC